MESADFSAEGLDVTPQRVMAGGFAYQTRLHAWTVHFQSPAELSFCVTPSYITSFSWCRNINLLSIAYAFRPRLRDRLTLSGLNLAQETLDLRRVGFSPDFIATCAGRVSSLRSSSPYDLTSLPYGMLPYHLDPKIRDPQLR